jgi:hypothetical protein
MKDNKRKSNGWKGKKILKERKKKHSHATTCLSQCKYV